MASEARRAARLNFVAPSALPSLRRAPFRRVGVTTCGAPNRDWSRERAERKAAEKAAEGSAQRERAKRLDKEFRQLQEEMRGVPGLEMFNADEYELDPRGVVWEQRFRGRDRAALEAAAAGRDGVEGFEGGVLADEDLFSAAEIAALKERAAAADLNGNRVWRDPMPATDFDAVRAADVEDDDFLHFRKFPSEGECDDAADRELEEECLVGVQYAGEEEERAALLETYRREDLRRAAKVESEVEGGLQNDAEVPIPDPDEYARWQRAAEARGGNASVGDSHALRPAKLATSEDVDDRRRREAGYHAAAAQAASGKNAVPAQRRIFVDVHAGEWAGVLSVHAIDDNICEVGGEGGSNGGDNIDRRDGNGSAGGGGRYDGQREEGREREREGEGDGEGEGEDAAPRDELGGVASSPAIFPPARGERAWAVTSRASLDEDGNSVVWAMTFAGGAPPPLDAAATCRMALAPKTGGEEALTPGRVVFADGSYVLQSLGNSEGVGGAALNELSISDDALLAIVGAEGSDGDEAAVCGVAEICAVTGGGSERRRVLLCARSGRLSHVVAVCEKLTSGGSSRAAAAAAALMAEQHASLDSALVGTWRGEGVSLHPYFSPYPAAEMTSVQDFERTTAPPRPQDLTYIKDDVSSGRAAVDGRAVRSADDGDGRRPRQKLSKRVVAALRRDAGRLAKCRLVSTEVLQEAMKERCAWEVVAGGLRSPRLGPRVPDYFALALPGGAVLIASVGLWNPGVRCRIELVVATGRGARGEGRERGRMRLIGARSAEGLVTGAALLCEAAASAP